VDEQRLPINDPTVAASKVASCSVEQQWVGRVAVVAVSGTVDLLTAPQLEQAIRAALDEKPAGLVIDFSDVEFLASAGMGVLVAVHDEVTPDMRFCVVAEGPSTSRPLKLVGIADLIKLYATRDEALSALSA
jgi:anti-sigma B factor antagonist